MANIYVRSTDGNDADNGSTWALAKATLNGAAAIDAAGDVVYVSQSHSESTTLGAMAFAGTPSNPVKVIAVNDGAEPPNTEASALSNVTSSITVISGSVYVQGMIFQNAVASGGGFSLGTTGPHHQTYQDCVFRCTANDSRPQIIITGGSTGSSKVKVVFSNTQFKFANAGQGIKVGLSGVNIKGGGLESGTTSPTTLFIFDTDRSGGDIHADGFDISAGGTSMAIFSVPTADNTAMIRNSKLPASWAGSLINGTVVPGSRAEMHNCDSADTNYRLWVVDYYGTIKSETTWVRTGGASDGTTNYSWVMKSSANSSMYFPLWSPEFAIWNDTVGSAITVDVEILHDSATALTDAECWLEVQYLGTSGFPLGNFVDDHVASVFATPANQTASSETWTTTGMTNPNKQVLSVTFTPQKKGYLQARVALAKDSTTIVVDPMMMVS